jgi:hypothetical protein
MNAAVWPTIREQEEVAAPRWQRPVPPAAGASQEAQQMLGPQPEEEEEGPEQLARGRDEGLGAKRNQ